MPADLFDPASRPSSAGSSRRVTVLTSVALHSAAVIIFVLAPLAGAISLPSVVTRIDDYMLAAALPNPPVPRPPAPARPTDTAPVNPAAAPTEAPRSIEPEVEMPAAGVPHITGGVFVAGGPGVPGGLTTESGVALAPPPPQAPAALQRVGGSIRPPTRVSYVAPVYPAIAQSARIEGTVILEAVISEAGEVTALKILRSVPLLDEAARAAVARWRYTPTTLNGVNVPVIMTVTVTFALR